MIKTLRIDLIIHYKTIGEDEVGWITEIFAWLDNIIIINTTDFHKSIYMYNADGQSVFIQRQNVLNRSHKTFLYTTESLKKKKKFLIWKNFVLKIIILIKTWCDG